MHSLEDIEHVFLGVLREGVSKKEIERYLQYFNNIGWQKLLGLIVESGLFPIFYARLLSLNLENIPSQFLLKLKNQYSFNLKRSIILEKELFRVLNRLNENNIRAIPLKGPILARRLYNDTALRRASIAGEIDLLVRKDKLIVVENLLRGLGYATNEKAVYGYHKFSNQILFCRDDTASGQFQVDLHWSMCDRFMRAHLEDFWLNAKEAIIDGRRVLMPCNEDLLLYLGLISIYSGGFVQIKYIYDMHSLIVKFNKEIDWQVLANRARQYNLNAMLFFVLTLSGDLFHTDAPSDLLNAVRPGFIKENLSKLWVNKTNVLRFREKISRSFIWHYFISNYLFSKDAADYIRSVYKKIFRPMDEVVWTYHYEMQPGPPYNLYIRRLIKPFINTLREKKWI